MNKDNLSVAEAYYRAMGEKNILEMEKYLHPEVRLVGPLAEVDGKEATLEAASRFCGLLSKLTIRAKFGSGNQAMLAFDVACPAPIGNCRTAVLLTFKDHLIAHIELFLDARPFEKKQKEIFASH